MADLLAQEAVLCVAQPEGFALVRITLDEAELLSIAVRPKAQGKGAGAALLASAQSESARLELFTATDNCGAQRFYGRHGFQVLRSGVGQGNDEGIADLFMAWERPQL